MAGAATVPQILGERLDAVDRIARAVHAGALLLSEPPSVRWLGVRSVERMHVLVSAGDALAVAPAGAEVPEDLEAIRFGDGRGPDEALRLALARAGIGRSAAVGLEPSAVPLAMAGGLDERPCPDVASALAQARACKDEAELALIARAAEIATIGQEALCRRLAAGLTELDLLGAAETAMRRVNGGLVEAAVDLMAGDRTTHVGAPPTPRTVRAGEPVLFDLAPRVDGYWADSCATPVCGSPRPALRRRHDAVRAALDVGLRTARAGVKAGGVDAAIRGELDRVGLHCPHHTGHGVGTAAQEPPWFVPGDDTVLEEGMVVALEPGAYTDGFGVRVEHLAVVETDQARPLTSHPIDLN